MAIFTFSKEGKAEFECTKCGKKSYQMVRMNEKRSYTCSCGNGTNINVCVETIPWKNIPEIICNEPTCEKFGCGWAKDCCTCDSRMWPDIFRGKNETPGAINELEMTNTVLRKITEARNKILKWPNFKDLGKTTYDEIKENADVKLALTEFGSAVDEEFRKAGKDLEEGTKHDEGKPRLGEMIMDFRKPLLEMYKVWEFGAKKYSKSNWKKVRDGEDRYTNALARHFAAEMDEVVDAETKLHHAIHVAWNALARLYFIIKDGE